MSSSLYIANAVFSIGLNPIDIVDIDIGSDDTLWIVSFDMLMFQLNPIDAFGCICTGWSSVPPVVVAVAFFSFIVILSFPCPLFVSSSYSVVGSDVAVIVTPAVVSFALIVLIVTGSGRGFVSSMRRHQVPLFFLLRRWCMVLLLER